jgi:hypothetical protein
MADLAVKLPGLSDPLISRLAREVARQIIPIPTLLQTFGISQPDFERLVDHPFFQQRLIEEQAVWSASDPMSATKRIGVKALTMIEELLVDVAQMIQDPDEPMSAKVEALKWASRMAGIGDNSNVKGGSADDAKVKITINIGGDKIQFDKEKLPQSVPL